MAQVGNSENRFGGEFMVQDQDHMGDIYSANSSSRREGGRQADQSQSSGRQQGSGEQEAVGQQGGEKKRKSR